MREVAPRASAAVAIGSRRNRWLASQKVDAPPASAARTCSMMVATGAWLSEPTPMSAIRIEPVMLLEGATRGVEVGVGEPGRGAERARGRVGILEPAGGQQRDHAGVAGDRAGGAQPRNRGERRHRG